MSLANSPFASVSLNSVEFVFQFNNSYEIVPNNRDVI